MLVYNETVDIQSRGNDPFAHFACYLLTSVFVNIKLKTVVVKFVLPYGSGHEKKIVLGGISWHGWHP